MLMTIGHSTLSAADLEAALDAAHVDLLVDVRSHPVSARNPQHNQVCLMGRHGGRYEWWPDLGGWTDRYATPERVSALAARGVDLAPYLFGYFPKEHIAKHLEARTGAAYQPGGLAADGSEWLSQGLANYAWFTALPECQAAMDRLLAAARERNVAIMCCEALWWKCHRGMLADLAVWRGARVLHIQPRFRKVKLPRCVVATYNHGGARDLSARLSAYPGAVRDAWRSWLAGGRAVSPSGLDMGPGPTV